MYVNYGTVKDFGDLEKLNISCKGKILVARYGKNFRGNKVCDKFIDINCTVKDDAIHPIHNDVTSFEMPHSPRDCAEIYPKRVQCSHTRMN